MRELPSGLALAAVVAAAVICLAGAVISPAANKTRAQAADSAHIDSLHTRLRDSLKTVAADTTLADSLTVFQLRRGIADSLSTTLGDTTGAGYLAQGRAIAAGVKVPVDTTQAGQAAAEPEGFHPSYKIGYRTDRDSKGVNQQLQKLNFNVGPRLSVNTNASDINRASKNVNIKTDTRTANSDLTYKLTDDVSVISNITLSSNVSTGGKQPKRTISSDNVQAGTEFKKELAESLVATFDLTGGTTGNRNPFYTSRGASGDLKSSLAYAPRPWVKATTDYDQTKARERSQNRGGGSQTTDKDSQGNLTSGLAFNLPGKSTIGLNLGAVNGKFQRPDTTFTLVPNGYTVTIKQPINPSVPPDTVIKALYDTLRAGQETKTLRQRNLGITSDLKFIPNLEVQIEGSLSRSLTDFVIQRNAYLLSNDRSGKVSAGYTLPTQTNLAFSLSSQKTRTNYHPDTTRTITTKTSFVITPTDTVFTVTPVDTTVTVEADRTGTTKFRTLNASISQPVGSTLTLESSGSISLQVYDYDNKVAFDQDRDVLDQRLTFKGSYKPSGLAKLDCEFSVRDSKSIYILASRSSQNSDATTYSLQPVLTLQLSPTVLITQAYGLDATYTEFTYTPNNNSVDKIASLTTNFTYSITPHVALSALHDYRDTEQGALLSSAGGTREFSPQSKDERQEIRVGVDYAATGLFVFSLKQDAQRERTWNYVDGVKHPGGTDLNQYLALSVGGKLNLGSHLQSSYQSALNLGEGPRVPSNQKRYLTASADLTYDF